MMRCPEFSGRLGGEFAGVRALDTHRPALDHIQLDLAAVAERQAGDLFLDGEFAAADPLHGALLDRQGDHDLVEDGGRLLHGAEHVAGDELIALPSPRGRSSRSSCG